MSFQRSRDSLFFGTLVAFIGVVLMNDKRKKGVKNGNNQMAGGQEECGHVHF